jgi:hypothetical protein
MATEQQRGTFRNEIRKHLLHRVRHALKEATEQADKQAAAEQKPLLGSRYYPVSLFTAGKHGETPVIILTIKKHRFAMNYLAVVKWVDHGSRWITYRYFNHHEQAYHDILRAVLDKEVHGNINSRQREWAGQEVVLPPHDQEKANLRHLKHHDKKHLQELFEEGQEEAHKEAEKQGEQDKKAA